MYDYNCPDCNEAKLQSDKNVRKINEVIDQVNALIQVNNETVDFIEEKANEVVEEIAEIKVNELLGEIKTSLANYSTIPIILSGATSSRPTENLIVGMQFFDTSMVKPIWWTGSRWVDSTGATV